MPLAHRRVLATLLVLLVPAGSAHAQGGDPGWFQPRADAAGTAAVDYPTVLADPVELWRVQVGELLAEPVSWGSFLYVLAEKGRDRALSVVDIASGELIDEIKVASGGRAHLAVWQGSVLIVEPDGASTIRHDGDELKSGKRVRGTFHGGPCVVNGTAFLTGPEELVAVDIVRGRVLAELELQAYGKPGFLPGGDSDGRLAVQRLHELGGEIGLELVTVEVADIGMRKPRFGEPKALRVEKVMRGADLQAPCYAVSFGIDEKKNEVWYLRAPSPVRIRKSQDLSGVLVVGKYGPNKSAPFARAPARGGEILLGFDPDGILVALDKAGRTLPVVEAAELPTGARVAPVTVAGDVALIGNWAVELGSGRVLWCLPELESSSPLLPVAPERLVAWTDEGIVLCLGPVPKEVESEVAEASAEGPAPRRPDAKSGLVLAGGTFLPGKVEALGDDGWRIEPEDGPEDEDGDGNGEPRTLAPEEVAFVESGDDSRLVGDEYPVFVAWRRALDLEAGEALLEHADSYARLGLIEDCRRLLDEARGRGVGRARLEEVESALVGRTQNTATNAERQRARVAREEAETRTAFVDEFLSAVTWCELRALPTAATVLLAHLDRFQPDLEVVDERADVLVPRGFPWADRADAPRLWMTWAEEILPAGAEFLAENDRSWKRLEDTVWESGTLGLTTRNLLFCTKSEDPEVVGACLRNGEGAMRVLEKLLGAGDGAASPSRLDVRIHASREDYLAEELPGGLTAMTWSAGFYSPVSKISRFYVSDEATDPLGRSLHETLAHELTHQWLAERWVSTEITGEHVIAPGFWIVEGFASFIDEQAVELGRRQGLDDPTVASIDMMSQLQEEGHVLDMKDFVDGTQLDFSQLSDDQLTTVRLSNTLLEMRGVTERTLFYRQAGAFVFFLMNRCGPEGREALVRYMRSYYELGSRRQGWKALGFEDLDELKEAFEGFLLEVGG